MKLKTDLSAKPLEQVKDLGAGLKPTRPLA
jgi:hypothetical protein